MNKKGEEQQSFLIIEVILGIIVATIFINAATNFDSISNSNTLYLKNDLEVLSETLLSSPGDIIYSYPIKSTYSVSVSDDSVTVSNNAGLIYSGDKYNLVFNKYKNSGQLGVANG